MKMGYDVKNPRTLRALIVAISLAVIVVTVLYHPLVEWLDSVSRNPYVRVGERSLQFHQLLLIMLAGLVAIIASVPHHTLRPLIKLYDGLNSDIRIYTDSYRRWVYVREYIALSKKHLELQKKLAKMQG
jgi:hypothetical protein